MAVTEESRHDLHTYFQESMGRERATVMMELLPPVGWGDVATKQDLVLLKQELHAVEQGLRKDIEHLSTSMATREDLANLKADIIDKMNMQWLAVVGVNITLFGLCVGVVTLLR